MSVLIDDAKQYMDDIGAEEFREVVNQEAPVVRKMKKNKLKASGRVVEVLARSGVHRSALMLDNDTYSPSAGSAPLQGFVQPRAHVCRIKLGKSAAKHIAGSGGTVDLISEENQAGASTVARHLESDILMGDQVQIDGYGSVSGPTGGVYTWSGISLGAAGAAFGADEGCANLFREEVSMDVIAGDGSTYKGEAQITSFTNDNDGSVSALSFTTSTNLGADLADANGNFYLRLVRPDDGTKVTSFRDITGTGDIYGITSGSSVGWTGVQADAAGGFTITKLGALGAKVSRATGNRMANDVVASSLQSLVMKDAHTLVTGASGTAGLQFRPGDKLDTELELAYDGKPYHITDNCMDTDIFLFDSKVVRLAEWSDFQVEDIIASETARSVLITVEGEHNVYTKNRKAVGRLAGTTLSV